MSQTMNKAACIVLLFFFLSIRLHSQDTLLLVNNSIIECKVVDVRLNSINYKKMNTSKSDIYNIDKGLVQYIFYNTGAIDTINPVIKKPQIQTDSSVKKSDSLPSENEYEKGMADGFKEFRKDGVYTLNGVAGAFFSVYGFFVPLIGQFTKANPANFTSPSYLLNKNRQYRKGYEIGASKKKHKLGWASFGVGVGVNALILGTAFLLGL